MEREEGIKLARFLGREYKSEEQLRTRIVNYEYRLDKPVDAYKGYRNIYYYFRPFLKASIITTLVMLLPAYVVASIAEFLAQSGGDHTHNSFRAPFIFVAGVFVLINIIGGIIARRKLMIFRAAEDHRVAANLELRKTMISELDDLKRELDEQLTGLEEYNALIPPDCRTQRHMKKAEELLCTNEAASLEEAVALINDQESNPVTVDL